MARGHCRPPLLNHHHLQLHPGLPATLPAGHQILGPASRLVPPGRLNRRSPAPHSAGVCGAAALQRVWASEDNKTVYIGSVIGCVLVVLLLFLSGFGGWLAMATGLATAETDPNL